MNKTEPAEKKLYYVSGSTPEGVLEWKDVSVNIPEILKVVLMNGGSVPVIGNFGMRILKLDKR